MAAVHPNRVRSTLNAEMAALVLSVLVTASWLAFLFCLPAKLRMFRRIPTRDEPSRSLAEVSIVIPARNEAENLPRCLVTLAAQDMPPREIVVVDDESTDGTVAVAQSAGVRVISVPKRPAGWIGKTWAAHQGARVARGDWLLFLDADVELAPAAVRAALVEAERRQAAVLTVIWRPEWSTFWEALVQPTLALLVLSHFAPARVNDPEDPHASASGGFLLFRREAYEAIGGHEAVRDQVMDDYRLAKAIKARGLRLLVVNASHLVTIRRRQSIGDMWNQSCRVLGGGLVGRPWAGVCGAASVAALFTGSQAAALWGLFAPGGATRHADLLVLLALLQTCTSAGVGCMLREAFDLDWRFFPLQSVGALFTVASLAYASLASFGGGVRVRWRGRRLDALEVASPLGHHGGRSDHTRSTTPSSPRSRA
jgi:hypothetical protein